MILIIKLVIMSELGSSASEDLPALTEPGEEEVGEYYFESDPLALKGSLDYQQLIRAFVKLQAQRAKAVQDLERLQEVREEALRDPLTFVTALQNGENLDLPGPQEVTQIPAIDWEKYNVESIMQGLRPKTRKRLLQENLSIHQDSKDSIAVCDSKVMVRGRMYDESKPQTFNLSWTDEEQRKLEELLMKYPEETVAYRRWLKISKELGSRTPLQVQSRVQKYFIALKRKGLPVPGRCPRITVRKVGVKRRGEKYAATTGRSNFMKAFNMYDESALQEDLALEGRGGGSGVNVMSDSLDVSDEEDIVEELRSSSEYQELLRMKYVRSLKSQEIVTGIVSHPGFSCDKCGVEPIVGMRWHCVECPSSVSVDLCGKCIKSNFTKDSHQPSHILQPIKAMCIRDTVAQ